MNQRLPEDLRFLSAVELMDRFAALLVVIGVAGTGIICAWLLCWLAQVLQS